MPRKFLRTGVLAVVTGLAFSLVACSSGPSPNGGDPGDDDSVSVSAGWVSAIDQIGLPAALDQGFFEDEGLDVTVEEPFASGVDQLNALETDQIQFAQVGTPVIGAILKGADYVLLGNYTGSASQLGIDETMGVVAREGSGVEEGDLSTLRGKKIGVTVGSINHLYLLSALQENGMEPADVEIVNTAAPDMAVALETSGIDAAIIWDPWPFTIQDQVPGSFLVTRGGGYIAFMGYIVAKRDFVEENPDVVEKFLRARATADQWMRENPSDAAQVATRWLSGMDAEIAEAAMEFNVKQLDPRISACNYTALDDALVVLNDLGSIDGTFDVNDVFVAGPITSLEESDADIFADLAPIPEGAQITDEFVYEEGKGLCS